MFFRLFIFLNFLFSLPTLGRKTEFVWKADPEREFVGECFEVDKETQGQKYINPASTERCRPKDQSLRGYHWVQSQNKAEGTCYLVDIRKIGKGYSQSVPYQKCQPASVENILLEGKCYLKGETEKGGVFLKRVTKKKCKSDEAQYTFVLDESGLSGKCFSVDPVSGGQYPESLSKCRPDEVQYLALDGSKYSNCYEVSNDGPQDYIKKADRSQCAPENMNIQWIQTKAFKGDCIKISGDFKEPADLKECMKQYNLTQSFFKTSPVSGVCVNVDKETMGGKFRMETSMSPCLPEKIEYSMVLDLQEKPVCLSYDPNDQTNGYVKIVSSKYCSEKISGPSWLQNENDPYRGQCIERYKVGQKLKEKVIPNKQCRPQQTKYVFIIPDPENRPLKARCFELPESGDPKEYSAPVNMENCKPKEVTIRYFHPKDFGKDGGCYEVDESTGGTLYQYKIPERKCKKKIL